MGNKDEIFENETFMLTDEDGNETNFEMLGTIEVEGQNYVALIPIEEGEDEAEEYVILRLEIDEDGEELLVTIDDDEEFDRVADEFEDAFLGDYDCGDHNCAECAGECDDEE